MKLPVYNQKAEKIDNISLSDSVFAVPMNEDLLHQVVTSQMSNQRHNLAHTKGRSEVRGGGKKPWRQKGTGRARHGSIRSPIWKGGGVTHGPTKERNFEKKINKKMAHKALLIALSSKVKDNQFIVLDDIKLDNRKTKEMAVITKAVWGLLAEKTPKTMLIVIPEKTRTDIRIASKNLPTVDVGEARNLNATVVLAHKYILVMRESLNIFK